MAEGEKRAMKSFFAYFDMLNTDEDDVDGNGTEDGTEFMLTRQEAIDGTEELAYMIGYFYKEFNFYWSYFDVDDD